MTTIDLEQLKKYVEDGLVDKIPDPEGHPLSIYNYTFEATKANNWTPTLLACRGLVVGDDGVVYARPFKKFFNIDEHQTTKRASLPDDEVPQLAEKLDGSLIIVFWHPYKSKWVAITRGCWTSDQAVWANKRLDVYPSYMYRAEDFFPTGDLKRQTYLFELIAPWNRIVVLYSSEKLVCIGVTDNETGEETDYESLQSFCKDVGWEAVKYITSPVDSIDLKAKFKNDEGYVAVYSNGLRVKLKYDEYFTIHAMMTGWSIRNIWEQLKDKIEVDLSSMPDEFLSWYEENAGQLKSQFEASELKALRAFVKVDPTLSRKEKAQLWSSEPHVVQSVCFGLLDKRPYENIEQAIWKTLRPEGNRFFKKEE